ncbi:MAG: ABC transporter permease [Proteobacteria bacterium]|nr:ABC transporter permease [Pseudomonadota bacterium]
MMVLFKSAYAKQPIIFQMIKREVLTRYKGTLLGLAWSFVTPLVLLGVYTYFFSIIFHVKWDVGQSDSQIDYTLMLFVGLIMHSLFSECVNRAPQIVISNPSFVKKIIFPLEILPWVALGAASFHMLISLLILLIAQWYIAGYIAWTVLLLPIILFPFMLIILGLSWFLAALGVYVRDIQQATSIFCSMMLFISPVFYSINMLPEKIRSIAYLNPLTFVINESRKVLLFGEMINGRLLVIYSVVSLIVAYLGYCFFQKVRRGFADVM